MKKLKLHLCTEQMQYIVGTSKLSLRTRTSMDFDDLINTVRLAHSLNKKVYAAMNIYARDEEYDLICEEAKHLDEIGVDRNNCIRWWNC